jgi:hypothetical protein
LSSVAYFLWLCAAAQVSELASKCNFPSKIVFPTALWVENTRTCYEIRRVTPAAVLAMREFGSTVFGRGSNCNSNCFN